MQRTHIAEAHKIRSHFLITGFARANRYPAPHPKPIEQQVHEGLNVNSMRISALLNAFSISAMVFQVCRRSRILERDLQRQRSLAEHGYLFLVMTSMM
jgi:hypothetical protein